MTHSGTVELQCYQCLMTDMIRDLCCKGGSGEFYLFGACRLVGGSVVVKVGPKNLQEFVEGLVT